MDTITLFNNPEYSDVRIKLDNGSIVHCHKIIICQRSKYFRKLCGPGSRFAESQQSEIELLDDDPDSLAAMLQFLYGKEMGTDATAMTWMGWLNLRVTADKYVVDDLSEIAFRMLNVRIGFAQRIDEIFEIIRTLQDEHDHDDELVMLAQDLRCRNLSDLINNTQYRRWLDEDKARLWTHVDQVHFATDLVRRDKLYCTRCKHVWWDGAFDMNGHCRSSWHSSFRHDIRSQVFWVSRDSFAAQ